MAYRQHVLALYRKVFRLARNWKLESDQTAEIKEEKKYMFDEARTLFRRNKGVLDETEIKEHIRECETRIELALHYQIPYPRPDAWSAKCPWTDVSLSRAWASYV